MFLSDSYLQDTNRILKRRAIERFLENIKDSMFLHHRRNLQIPIYNQNCRR